MNKRETVDALLYSTSLAVASLPNVRVVLYEHPPHQDRWLITRGDSYLSEGGFWRKNDITFFDSLEEVTRTLALLFPPAKLRNFQRGRGRGAEGYEVKTKPRKGTCPVVRCRRPSSERHCGLCVAHYMLRWRKENPERAAYNTLRDHAKDRKLEFTLSFDYFCGLAHALRYTENSGTFRGMLTIDRVDPTKGYVPGNLRVISVEENTAKGNRERYLPEHVQAILARSRGETTEPEREPEPDENDENWNPF